MLGSVAGFGNILFYQLLPLHDGRENLTEFNDFFHVGCEVFGNFLAPIAMFGKVSFGLLEVSKLGRFLHIVQNHLRTFFKALALQFYQLLGIARAKVNVGLMNLALNLRRLTFLQGRVV